MINACFLTLRKLFPSFLNPLQNSFVFSNNGNKEIRNFKTLTYYFYYLLTFSENERKIILNIKYNDFCISITYYYYLINHLQNLCWNQWRIHKLNAIEKYRGVFTNHTRRLHSITIRIYSNFDFPMFPGSSEIHGRSTPPNFLFPGTLQNVLPTNDSSLQNWPTSLTELRGKPHHSSSSSRVTNFWKDLRTLPYFTNICNNCTVCIGGKMEFLKNHTRIQIKGYIIKSVSYSGVEVKSVETY